MKNLHSIANGSRALTPQPQQRLRALPPLEGAPSRGRTGRRGQAGAPRPYLSFPRGIRLPSPRILFHAGDTPEQARRALALALGLTDEFASGSVVLASASNELTRWPTPPRIEVVKVPAFGPEEPPRPLARERIRRLRRRLLASLFDAYLPDLVLFDVAGSEAEEELRTLLVRVTALESAHLVLENPHGRGVTCSPEDAETPDEVCPDCLHGLRTAARHAYARCAARRR